MTTELKRKARSAVTAAIASGRLVRQPCAECGLRKSEAHHTDYSKPLDVEWLCRKHHAKRHSDGRTEWLHIRMTAKQLQWIQLAAVTRQQTVSAYMRQSALQLAEAK